MRPTSQPASAVLNWNDQLEPLVGEPVATLALSRDEWEALGARFFEVEDPIGGITRIATGVFHAEPNAGVPGPFGVLDHGEDTTFLVTARNMADDAVAATLAAGVAPEAVLE